MIEQGPFARKTPENTGGDAVALDRIKLLHHELETHLEEARDTAASILQKYGSDEAAMESEEYKFALGKVFGFEVFLGQHQAFIETQETPIPDDLSSLLPPAANM
jgi:hypothetical protein